MQIPLSPIMLALLAATLPATLWAAERGQIVVADPAGATRIILDPGDTVTYAGRGAAIDVSVAGNAVSGDNVTIQAGSGSAANTAGVRALSGGSATLTNSTVQTLGVGSNAHALHAQGAGSIIQATDTQLSTQGQHSYGAYAVDGGQILLDGGAISTTGASGYGLRADGANAGITAKNLSISILGYADAVSATNGATVTLENVQIKASPAGDGRGLYASGKGSLLSVRNTDVEVGMGMGVRLEGARLEMDGGSLTSQGGSGVILSSFNNAPPSSADIRNATLTVTGRYVYGININADNTSAVIENVFMFVDGTVGGTGVWLPSTGTAFTARNFNIAASDLGVDNRAGTVVLEDGSVSTQSDGGHALYVSREYGSTATIKGTRVNVETFGAGAVGALARISGAEISLVDSTVTTHGQGAYGLFASGSGAKLSMLNTTVTTEGAAATGLAMSNRAAVTLDNARFLMSGADARGIWSYTTAAGVSNAVTLRNGTQISTQDGAGLLASGGGHTFTIENSGITARTGGVEDNGVLLHARAVTVTSGGVSTDIESEHVILDATNSALKGDVLMDSGNADIALKSGSVLTGAVVQRGPGRVNSLSLDGSSVWNVRNDSSLGTLTNAGTVAITSPGAGGAFKTLTVNNYVGGGTLVLNTWLGDDASPTDRLVIDGGAASGTTSLRIVNAGGAGGQTQRGIRVVETINGGTTATDAFRLDAGSTGYRSSSSTLALNGYDYSLVRGGNGGTAPDWYLTSDYTPPVDPPVTPPVTPPVGPPVAPPVTPPDILLPPVAPAFKNVSPESGAYVGNQRASTRLFTHSLHDRTVAYPDADDAASDGRRLWARAEGRHDGGMSMREGKVDIDTDSGILQLGGDLLRAPVGQGGAAYAGLMGGYGEARTRSTSTLMQPGSDLNVHARARGKVSGYSVGVYATVYQNDATRLGGYADTSLQYGRYSNQISSELGSTRYRSNVWSASLESGYALMPFPADSALGQLVVEPNAQVVYSRYDANDATLQGTRMSSGNDHAWTSRVGVRVYPAAKPEAGVPAVRPFLETNWLHSGSDASVRMGTSTLDAVPARNALELKLGAEGRVGKAVQVSGHIFGQAGNDSQRGYGGMLSMRYFW